MEEEQTTPTETTEEVVEEEKKTKIKDRVDDAREEREKMEKVLKTLQDERQRLEKLRAEQMFAGRAEAGSAPPKKKELTPEEYAQRARAGDKSILKE